MQDLDSPNVLAVGAKLANLARARCASSKPDAKEGEAQTAEVVAGRGAFDLLRVLRFDVVAVGTQLPDMTPWEFARRMKALWPWQKWALVADSLTSEEEQMARTLGAVAVLEGPNGWRSLVDVAAVIRRRNPASTVPGLKLKTGTTGR
jgi:DNA-binding response OmpR family regulator